MHGRGGCSLWRDSCKYFRTSLTLIGPSRRRVKTLYREDARDVREIPANQTLTIHPQ